MNLPTLYKLSDTGAIIVWNIATDDTSIITSWGQEGGATQRTTDIIADGKNIGRKNETTPQQQAAFEAEARWTKQQKNKKYVLTREAALAGERSALIKGGADPMLAHKYRDHAAKITYPAFVQYKYDGLRIIAHVKDGQCTLWSRTRKPIHSLVHIQRACERLFPVGEHFLDGEGYNHQLRADFEKITSLIRKDHPNQPDAEMIHYHIYDVIQPCSFAERSEYLKHHLPASGSVVLLAPTFLVHDEDQLLEFFQESLSKGYEGCMIRNSQGGYEHKRSYNLQKVKEMQDSEYRVVGVEAGRGTMADKAVFICETGAKDRFSVKLKGNMEDLKIFLLTPSLVVGKMLTVQYQNLSARGIPRFPVGLRIRQPE